MELAAADASGAVARLLEFFPDDEDAALVAASTPTLAELLNGTDAIRLFGPNPPNPPNPPCGLGKRTSGNAGTRAPGRLHSVGLTNRPGPPMSGRLRARREPVANKPAHQCTDDRADGVRQPVVGGTRTTQCRDQREI